ncbi:MAG TPA: hypothetical protein QGH56_06285 [Candidatus Marinimicrobia bacterium]|jgi:hypothetical protein|nr:hypothetical protein [Candidatus Neomarinimicrobiota bacterium]|tara:strand:+ start:2047 stop:2298 length:252 start_codon:yes stop_codon:yes gene_type:complete
MKKIIKPLLVLPLVSGLIFAHIPQPKDASELSGKQIEEISRVVGELHKQGASHDELHKAVVKLYKQWNIKFKKLDIKKRKSQN